MRRIWLFAGGLAVLAVALTGPLEEAADTYFSAHMAEHELIMMTAAPLLVLAHPFRWLPGRARRPIARATPRWLLSPLVAFVVFGAVHWLWHLPAMFDAALVDERVHALEHATFLGAALLFWGAVFAKRSRGTGVAMVFATSMHTGFLAAVLSLSTHPWYAPHAERTLAAGGDPVADQQLGGLIMWVPFAVVMTAIGLAIMGAWLRESERRALVLDNLS